MLEAHRILGYLVFALALGVTIWGYLASRKERPTAEPPLKALGRTLAGLLDLQVLLGALNWGWTGAPPWAHPALAVLAAVSAHVAQYRGRQPEGAREALRFHLATLLLLLIAIGLVSVPGT